MIKKLFIFLLILIVAAAAGLYFFGANMIKSGVEKYGSEVTQTPVRLEGVGLSSIFSGNATLTGLYVGNPEGYKSENIFGLGKVEVDVDTETVMSDKIIINKIIIQKPEISYEKTLMSSNLKELLKNIEAFTKSSEENTPTPVEGESTADSGSSKQVVIKQLIIEDGTIYVGLMGAGKTVALPRIEMNDIGETGNEKSPAEILELVLNEVLQSIGPAIANGGDIIGDSGKAILDNASKQGEDALEKAKDGLKGLLGN
jgi:hypothetical protein